MTKLIVLLCAFAVPQLAVVIGEAGPPVVQCAGTASEPALPPIPACPEPEPCPPSIEIYGDDPLIRCRRLPDSPDGSIRVVCTCGEGEES